MVEDFKTLDELTDFIAKRIYGAREQEGVSAQTMSVELGHNKAYINKIENKGAKPSIEGLYDILDYFDMPLRVFFDQNTVLPGETVELMELSKKLTPEEMNLVLEMCRHLTKNKE